jgi:hypothetical protein
LKVTSESGENLSVTQLLQKTYFIYYSFVAEITDDQKAHQLAKTSYNHLLDYFHNLKTFQLTSNGGLIPPKKITENEILAFSVWMQQFFKELKDFVIGLGNISSQDITAEIHTPLEEIHFYDYFDQAEKLDY